MFKTPLAPDIIFPFKVNQSFSPIMCHVCACAHMREKQCLLTALALHDPYPLELYIKKLLPLTLIYQLSLRD